MSTTLLYSSALSIKWKLKIEKRGEEIEEREEEDREGDYLSNNWTVINYSINWDCKEGGERREWVKGESGWRERVGEGREWVKGEVVEKGLVRLHPRTQNTQKTHPDSRSTQRAATRNHTCLCVSSFMMPFKWTQQYISFLKDVTLQGFIPLLFLPFLFSCISHLTLLQQIVSPKKYEQLEYTKTDVELANGEKPTPAQPVKPPLSILRLILLSIPFIGIQFCCMYNQNEIQNFVNGMFNFCK
jgi:hypothetical protein